MKEVFTEIDNGELMHYGIPRKSGRYPWGSGDDPYQRNISFMGYVKDLQKKGLTEKEIAEGLGMNTSQLRARKSLVNAEIRAADTSEALKLKNKGYSNVAIGERMGKNESTIRSLLDPALKERSDITITTAKMLKEQVAQKGLIDVGLGVENHIGISRTKLKTAIAQLEEEGYKVHYVKVEQVGLPGKYTSVMVLSNPDVPYSEVFNNRDQIKTITDHSNDFGRSYLGLEPINSISGKRVSIRYAEDGGADKDGVIELRRGIDDISLGDAKYAQVRIGVDGTRYLKGMAVYSDKMPEGVDIVFNTNKNSDVPKMDVMKTMKADMNDPKVKEIKELGLSTEATEKAITKGVQEGSIKVDSDNPFGSTVRQRNYIDKNGKEKLSTLNVVYEEGEWGKWSKTLSSQMLSKQPPSLAKQQLGLAYKNKKEEYDELKALTNPLVKKQLLMAFADDADASAVHLKAASMPRQMTHVILPIPNLKENEIYAPNFRDGESVVLIRHPHGGTFEIPQLIVNNRSKDAKSLMANAKDAVGINAKVAQRLSGADFDGDTVLVIPNNKGLIQSSSPLKGLQNFDPIETYRGYEGMPKMSDKTKQMQMGNISNLITDMTIKAANPNEIARAVRHSMVVIDAQKHNLNYKLSATDNGISSLKAKYQGGETRGASTLISRASSEIRVPVRKETIDPKTGKRVFTSTDETYVNKKGQTVVKTQSSTRMFETSDARSLSSGTPMELVYANHANQLKALANTARKEALSSGKTPYSPSARAAYQKEVDSLKRNLNIAIQNKPIERQAQILANSVITKKVQSNPGMEATELKKIKGQALAEARARTGAKKQTVKITEREWEAIQAGAVSPTTLSKILNNTDLDIVKQYATPRTSTNISTVNISRAKSMLNAGRTQAEVAQALGISTSTLSKALQ